MTLNKIKIVLLAGTSLFVLSCHHTTTTTTTQTQPAATATSRLIFTGTVHTGGDVKITIDDPALEAVLDGNPNYSGLSYVCLSFPCFAPRSSFISVEMTDLNYYGDSVSITCVESDSFKIPLTWRGSIGESLYEYSDGTMYAWDNVGHYYEQGTNEAIVAAIIPDYFDFSTILQVSSDYFFSTDCTGDDGADYRLSFYDSSVHQVQYSHGITTTFSVTKGTVEGIIKVHRIGDNYHPDMDILL